MIFYLLLLFTLLAILRSNHQKALKLEYTYKIQALRAKLEGYYNNGLIEEGDKGFTILYVSMQMLEYDLYKVNLYSMAFTGLIYKFSTSQKLKTTELVNLISKNQYLKEIDEEYTLTLVNYTSQLHKTTPVVLLLSMLSFIGFKNLINKANKKLIKGIEETKVVTSMEGELSYI